MLDSQALPTATIVITTKNRKDDLARALRSAIAETAAVEVLMIDDGSQDGTSEMVRAQFPGVRVERFETSAGLIVRRNIGAKLARAPIIVSIDDDAEFSTPHVVAQILPFFSDPKIGAVAIPFKEPGKTGDILFQVAPSDSGVWRCAYFIGTAHALRRNIFLSLGSYRGDLVHQGEELDYGIRMIDAGYCTIIGRSDPILHHESPIRDWQRMDYYGSRNTILFAWQNAPALSLIPLLAGSTIKVALFTLEWSRLKHRIGAIVDGYRCFMRFERRPVSRARFSLFRGLKKQGPEQLR